jgi:TPR repeat protein
MSASNFYNRSLDLLTGQGVRKDEKRSFALNSEAAKLGHHDAVLAMGWYYLNGVGVARDVKKAKIWYRKSARHGQQKAMFSLGQMAYDERDYSDALIWFNRAAKAGHDRSLYWIGKLHWRGHGVRQDRNQAMALFQKAAKKKVREARRFLKFIS